MQKPEYSHMTVDHVSLGRQQTLYYLIKEILHLFIDKSKINWKKATNAAYLGHNTKHIYAQLKFP